MRGVNKAGSLQGRFPAGMSVIHGLQRLPSQSCPEFELPVGPLCREALQGLPRAQPEQFRSNHDLQAG